jgi:uncharacterized membrane protein
MTDETQPGAIPAQPQAAPAQISGIGGWLILPMLGLIATPVLQLINLMGLSDTFANLNALGSTVSNLVVIESIINFVLFVVAPVLLLIQLFGKKRAFPRWYVIWTAASAAFVVIDLLIGYAVFHDSYEATGTPFIDNDTVRALIQTLVSVCVWIPYMLNSVRVKNTFVK